MKIILIGIQGAGKSTQGNLVSKKFKIPYLSSGHIFREMAKEKTPLGRYMKEVVNSGILVPDNKALPVVEEYLNKPEYQQGYILDGFPRTLKQAKQFNNGVDLVVYLKVSDKEALWRLSGRVEDGVREDNTIQALRKRIALFHQHASKVLEYYRQMNQLLQVDGEQDVDTVFNNIASVLSQFK